MPKISIILPTYKPKEYIDECIKSIANQTFQDFELIIILNGCNEPYYDYIKSVLSKYKIEDKTNLIQTSKGGVSNARNIGLDNALGEYIAFVDDDDYISSQYLEELLKCSTNNCVGISNVKSLILNDNNVEVKDNAYSIAFLKLYNNGFNKIYKSFRLLNGPWGKLFHRDIIQSFRFYKAIPLGEDALFNFTISKNYQTLCASTPNAIYYYRQIETNSWSKRSRTQFISILIKILDKYISTYLSNPNKYSSILFLNRVLVTIKEFSKRIIFPNS